MKKSLLALSVTLASVSSFAEEAKKLATDIELGVISTSGNTETTSVKGKIEVKQELERFRNSYLVEGLYKQDQVDNEVNGVTVSTNQKTADKFFLSAQSDFKLNKEHRGMFLYGSYEQDKFSGFNYQSTIAIGYSDRLFNYDHSYLNYSVGPGASITETNDTVDENDNVVFGESSTTGVIRISLDFLYKISENAKFTQTLSSDVAVDQEKNSKTKAVSALTANLTKAFALKASFTVKQNTHVPADKTHADTETAMTFVYSF